MTLVDEAIRLSTSFPVFPCKASKAPACPLGFKAATSDPVEIRRLFNGSGALIGVPTGEASGFDVLDVDPRHGGQEWEEQNRHRLPETRIHQTMSGGRHWLFRHVEGVHNSASAIAPGIDMRGEGGYVVVPPSPGYSVVSEAEIAHWPDWLLAEILPKTRDPAPRPAPSSYDPIPSARLEGFVRAVLARVSAAPEGQKHFILRNQAMVLGGIAHLGPLSHADLLRRLMDALPATVLDRKNAEKTARWGLDAGAQNPLDLPDRPKPNGGNFRPEEPPPPISEYGDGQASNVVQYPGREQSSQASRKTLLWSSTAAWSEADIRPRPWVVPGHLMTGSVTLLSGAGSAGKSMLIKAWCIAAILATAYSRFAPPKPLRILSYNVEDDLDEEWRRLSATLRQFSRVPADIAPSLMLVGPHDVGTLIERDQYTGRIHLTPAMDELEDLISNFKPAIVFLDPLVELHTSEENDNTGLRAVIAQLRTLARRQSVAIGLLHHTRKGATAPGDPDSSRGAGSIVGAARIVFTVCAMSEDEAAALGVALSARKNYFRLDGAKMNYAAIGEPEWFERMPYELDNGETVAAAIPWTPPQKTLDASDYQRLLQAIAVANPPLSARLSADVRSFAEPCRRLDLKDKKGQQKALAVLMEQYGVTVAIYERERGRGEAQGLRTAEGEPAKAPWKD